MVILDDGTKSPSFIRGYEARQEEVDTLTARVRELEAALAEYAKEKNWSYNYYEDWRNGANIWTPNPDHSDDVSGPDIARTALAGRGDDGPQDAD